MRTRFWLVAGLLGVAGASSLPARARAESLVARLEPDSVAVGEDATLSVSTDDAALGPPRVPAVPGLEMQSVGQQTQMSMINGVTQRSVTYLYRVQPMREGDFTIAGIRAGTSVAQSLALHVTAGGQNRSNGQPQMNPAASRAVAGEQPSGLAFMRLRVDKQRVYAGQSMPFTVQAYFRGGTGVVVKGRPELSSDAFTVSGLDDSPTQAQVTVAGVPYLAVTWRGAMTAVKSGDHPLDMSLPISLQYREAQPTASTQPRHSLRDLFGSGSPFSGMMQDPLFDSMLDQPMFDGFEEPGRLVTRDLTLRGRAGQAHVLALPEANKPADFSGAIGQFELQASLPSTQLTQGEPVDLKFTIAGKGNFGQFKATGIVASDAWKAYAAHDTFKSSDKLGLSGTSQYVQPIAANRSGDLDLPGLRFSYFDPIAEHYVTKTTPAIAVHVAAAEAAQNAAVVTPNVGPSPTVVEGVAVQSLAHGGVPNWLVPLAAAALLLALLIAGGARWLHSSQHARLFERVRAARLIAQQRRAMQRAARDGDRIAYLRSGRQAIQQSLAAAWHVTPESISSHELDRRWPSAPDTIRRVFELADQADYAGGRLESTSELTDLAAWSRRVDSQITHMEIPS